VIRISCRAVSCALTADAASQVPGSLSLSLDRTLKTGHDMRVFGLGQSAGLPRVPMSGPLGFIRIGMVVICILA
jgi:hypothetical protein